MPRRAPSAAAVTPPPPKRTRSSRRKARRVEASEPIVWLNEAEESSAMCKDGYYTSVSANRPWLEVGTRQSED